MEQKILSCNADCHVAMKHAMVWAILALKPSPNVTRHIFKLVHHAVQTVGKRVVGIGLKCLLIFHSVWKQIFHSRFRGKLTRSSSTLSDMTRTREVYTRNLTAQCQIFFGHDELSLTGPIHTERQRWHFLWRLKGIHWIWIESFTPSISINTSIKHSNRFWVNAKASTLPPGVNGA